MTKGTRVKKIIAQRIAARKRRLARRLDKDNFPDDLSQPMLGASSPTCVGADGWPTLGELIAEARDWYYSNLAALHDPHGFVTDLQSELRR